jgi:deoxyribonuclease V
MRLSFSPAEFEVLTRCQAMALQRHLAARIREEEVPGGVRAVAGLDASYDERKGRTFAAAILWDIKTQSVVETTTASAPTRRPYVPGLFAWRELPALLAAFGRLRSRADLVLVDGHGRAHPRRCGLACLVGLALEVPTAGCAKSPLVGTFSEPSAERGSRAQLVDRGDVVGAVLRTRTGVRPVYVSVGHLTTLESACARVLAVSRFRIPEPLREAHAAAARLCAAGSHGT